MTEPHHANSTHAHVIKAFDHLHHATRKQREADRKAAHEHYAAARPQPESEPSK